MIYLDNNSTTKVDPRVLRKMLPYFSKLYNNPHSQNTIHNKKIVKDIETARKNIAKLIGAETKEIIFTSGATEANNLAIKGQQFKIKNGRDHFVSYKTEHKCVLEAIRKMEFYNGKSTILSVSEDGLIDLEKLEKNITSNTILVSVMMANNETGVIQPIKEIANICKKKKVLFHTDAAQAVGKIEIDVKKLDIDMMSISAHKFYGPKGIGALYLRSKPKIRLNQQIDGGGQEFNIRSGTLPVPLCIGFGEAARLLKLELKKDYNKTLKLRNYFIKKLKKEIKYIHINGNMKSGLPATLNFSILGIKSNELISKLKNTVVSSGSACTSNSIEPSYVLSSMGLERKIVHSAIRVGFGKFNSIIEVDKAIKDFKQAYRGLIN